MSVVCLRVPLSTHLVAGSVESGPTAQTVPILVVRSYSVAVLLEAGSYCIVQQTVPS